MTPRTPSTIFTRYGIDTFLPSASSPCGTPSRLIMHMQMLVSAATRGHDVPNVARKINPVNMYAPLFAPFILSRRETTAVRGGKQP